MVIGEKFGGFKKILLIIYNETRNGVRVTSENVTEIVRSKGIKANNSLIRRAVYKGIDLGIVRFEMNYGAISKGVNHYIPETYEVDVDMYRRRLAKRLDSYLREKLAGMDIVMRCKKCGFFPIDVSSTACPRCGSRELEFVDKEEAIREIVSKLKKIAPEKFIEFAEYEIKNDYDRIIEELRELS